MAEAKPVPSAMASPKWLQLRPKGQEEVQMLSPRGITTENACPTVKHRTEMKNKAAGAMTSGNPAEEAPELHCQGERRTSPDLHHAGTEFSKAAKTISHNLTTLRCLTLVICNLEPSIIATTKNYSRGEIFEFWRTLTVLQWTDGISLNSL